MTTAAQPRARDRGLVFDGTPGPLNAITDVAGVEVGYVTLLAGEGALRVGSGPVRTGVTAILPRGRHDVGTGLAAGWHALNGNGEMTGTAWLDEAGSLAHPIAITNTHAVGSVHQGIINWVVRHRGDLARGWIMPVVAETWDGYLNDVGGAHVRPEHAGQAIEAARPGPVAEGSFGGGTGMNCYGFKGGNGTASRSVQVGAATYTVGVFTQANFGSREELVVRGRPLGRVFAEDNPLADPAWLAPPGAGSCIVVVATDAPLLPGQCKALARRVPLGLARTGTSGSHYSGDLFLAFSTANSGAFNTGLAHHRTEPVTLSVLPWGAMDPLYDAVVQAVEEAVLNVLSASVTMVGRDGHRSPGVPSELWSA
jgi:L-aminopeptidase/D-esterase-like protein